MKHASVTSFFAAVVLLAPSVAFAAPISPSASASASASASSPASSNSQEQSASASSALKTTNCSGGGRAMVNAIDSSALSAVTKVDVERASDCSGLDTIDGGAAAAIAANPKVAAALQTAGASQVLAYDLEGTTLTVYAK